MTPRIGDTTKRLDPAECWEFLRRSAVGRLAVIVDHHPEIFPINFVVDGNSLVFRTEAGTKFWSALQDPCALEVDGYGPPAGTAWSVMVKGQAVHVEGQDEKTRIDKLKLNPWQPGSKEIYLRVNPTSLTGRHFRTTLPDVWDTPSWDARTELFR